MDLLRADDARPHLRGGAEGALRRRIVGTGRLYFVLYMTYFARRPAALRRPALLAAAAVSVVHGHALVRLYALYRAQGRSGPPAPPVGVAHGLMGYACLAALLAGDPDRPGPLTRAAEWYPYVGLGVVDVLDGAVRRGRRPLRHYALLTAATVAAGAARRGGPRRYAPR